MGHLEGIDVGAGWGQLGMNGPAQNYGGVGASDHLQRGPTDVHPARATKRLQYSVPELSGTSDSETKVYENAELHSIEAVGVYDPRHVYGDEIWNQGHSTYVVEPIEFNGAKVGARNLS